MGLLGTALRLTQTDGERHTILLILEKLLLSRIIGEDETREAVGLLREVLILQVFEL